MRIDRSAAGRTIGRGAAGAAGRQPQYDRNDYELKRGRFRVRGDVIDIMPAYSEQALRVELFGDEIEAMSEFDPLSGAVLRTARAVRPYPANQYVTTKGRLERAIAAIKKELDERVAQFESEGKLYLEAQRIRMRTNYDLEMLQEMGFCNGIENYSRTSTAGQSGEPAVLPDRFLPEGLPAHHRRKPRDDAADRRHVQRRPRAQADPGRLWLPPAVGARQPPQSFEEFEAVTGQTSLCLGHARPVTN
jgi:excinuclease ABC subunit B